jgi:hypothetical protein
LAVFSSEEVAAHEKELFNFPVIPTEVLRRQLGLSSQEWQDAPKTLVVNNIEKETKEEVKQGNEAKEVKEEEIVEKEATPPNTPFADTSKKRQTVFFYVSMDSVDKGDDEISPEVSQDLPEKVIL